MSLAVLDLDLANLPESVPVDARHAGAWILLRLGDRAVGVVERAVVDGRIATEGLEAELRHTVDHGLDEALVDRFLDRPAPTGLPTLAIAICTHERPDDLRRCLRAATRVRGADEILVVDSGPHTERTRAAVEEFRGVHYTREDRIGLDRARNRAMREARADAVAFTDDDAVPDTGWLEALRPRFADPLVMAVTGLTLPAELDTPAQLDHERHSTFSRGFRRRTLEATRCSPAAAGNPGAGVNMALRRSVVQLVGPFDEALDAGTATRSGGDTEMFHRILGRGYRIAYEPAALVLHHHRREAEALERAFFGYGTGVYAAFTASLIREGELSVVRNGLVWLLKHQLRDLVQGALGREGALPPRLGVARLAGSLLGPVTYGVGRWMR